MRAVPGLPLITLDRLTPPSTPPPGYLVKQYGSVTVISSHFLWLDNVRNPQQESCCDCRYWFQLPIVCEKRLYLSWLMVTRPRTPLVMIEMSVKRSHALADINMRQKLTPSKLFGISKREGQRTGGKSKRAHV